MVNRRTIAHNTGYLLVSICLFIMLNAPAWADDDFMANVPDVPRHTNTPPKAAPSTIDKKIETPSPIEESARDVDNPVVQPEKSITQPDGLADDGSGQKKEDAPEKGSLESQPILSVNENLPVGPRGNTSLEDGKAIGENTKTNEVSIWKLMFSLIFVIGLIIGVAYLFRRFALGTKAGRDGQVVQTLSRSVVGPKQTINLIKVGRRLLMVGISPNHMTTLMSFDDPDEIATIMGLLEKYEANSISSSFDKLFHKESDEYDDGDDEFAYTEDDSEGYNQNGPSQYGAAKKELNSLMAKVKSLTRMRQG